MPDLSSYQEHSLLPRLSLGHLLSYAAKKNNVTERAIAEATGRSLAWAKSVRYGRRFPLDYEITKQVAQVLGIKPSFLWCMVIRERFGGDAWTAVEDLLALELQRNISDTYDSVISKAATEG